jgi:hypothetical protein
MKDIMSRALGKDLTFVIGLLLLFTLVFSNFHQEISSSVVVNLYTEKDEPSGIPLNEWIGQWWNWWIKVPKDALQSDGAPKSNCLINKSNSMVMLMETTLKKKPQECNISSKESIMIPLWTAYFYDYPADALKSPKTYQQLDEIARSNYNHGFITGKVSVDNIPVASLNVESSKSGVKVNLMQNVVEVYAKGYNITVYEDTHKPGNLVGTFPAGAHGWFVFLKPLSIGDHTISYDAGTRNTNNPNAALFTYKFHVS